LRRVALALAITVGLAPPVLAQTSVDVARPDTVAGQPAAPRALELLPVFEGGPLKNRGLSIPANPRFAPVRRIDVGYTASNSFLNPGLVCTSGSNCPIEYETDHTGNLVFVSLSQPINARWEFSFATGGYRLDDIPRWMPLHQLASDRMLRRFHEDILREDSLPQLSHAPDGRQRFSLNDLAGRELTLTAGRAYALPLRLDLTRFVDIRRTDRARMGFNAGIHLTRPIDAEFARGVDLGLTAGFVHALRMTANVTATFEVQIARFRSDVHVVNPASPQNADDALRSLYTLTFGWAFAGTFGGRAPCAFAIGQRSNTAHYDKGTYWTWDPLVREGGGNLRRSLVAANDFGVLSFGCERRRRTLQLALVEDIGGVSQLTAADGAGSSYDPDFAVSLAVGWKPGRARRD